MIDNWTFNKYDEKVSKELQGFLPDRIFDIHAHIYRTADLHIAVSGLWTQGPQEVSIDVWRELTEKQVGTGRLQGGLFIPVPVGDCDIERENDYLQEQLETAANGRGLILISPEYPEYRIGKYLDNPKIIGFKPYHLFSKEKPTFQSSIPGYIPERIWQIADRRKLVIMLHLVRDNALADTENQKDIRKMCEKYPNAKLILAHAGRGFHSENTVIGLSALSGIENLWFDTSAICESRAMKAILKEFGSSKLLWGSDFPVSQIRGKCVTIGDGFAWLDNNTVNWDKLSPACNPILVGLESFKALMEAIDDLGLSGNELQDIFCDNSLKLLGMI